ncbi:MAG: dipeptidase [Steroidobacteraceae bacterium]|jgi:membrane dipeptidase|nr:dipeptidase [Steroidobacteraceae bacterium]
MNARAVSLHPLIRAAVAAGLLLACSLVAAAPGAPMADDAPVPEDAALRHARRLLRSTILFDGHNDLPIAIRGYAPAPSDVVAYDLRSRTPGETDIPRLRAGGVGAQFWSVYIAGEGGGPFARVQLEQIDLARRMIARYPDTFRLAGTAAEVRAAHRAGRIASMLGMEGGYGLENSLGPLRAYYDLGVRYMTLTHNTHTDWADSAGQLPPRHGGLTPFGEEVVREMNRLGMLVDLAHTSAETMADALRVSEAPVIWSHASARGVCDVPRNVPDEILRELPRNGGVVMVTFVAPYADCEVAKVTVPATMELGLRARAATSAEERRRILVDGLKAIKVPPTSIGKVADHIEHVRKVAGVEHVGIGGDFDGNPWWPTGLSDVSMYPNLFAELIRRGWSDRDLRRLAGENVLRAMEQAEKVARRLQAARPASTLRFEPAAPPGRAGAAPTPTAEGAASASAAPQAPREAPR